MAEKAKKQDIILPTEYYLGFKFGQDFDTEKYPLAFMTPNGTDAAALKRKATVDDWCKGTVRTETGKMLSYEYGNGNTKEYPEVIVSHPPGKTYDLKNTWRTGFAFSEVRSRYSTDNKVYQIKDPLGFTLEVYSENLAELLLDGTIVDGVIQGEHTWARYKQKPFLLKRDGILHREFLSYSAKLADAKTEKIEVGDFVGTDAEEDDGHVYLGEFYIVHFSFDVRSTGYYSYYRAKPDKRVYDFNVNVDKKPWKHLSNRYKNSKWVDSKVEYDGTYRYYMTTKRNWGKKDIRLGTCSKEEFDEHLAQLNVGDIISKYASHESDWTKYGAANVHFRTKEEMNAWVDKHVEEDWATIKEAFLRAHPDTEDTTYEIATKR